MGISEIIVASTAGISAITALVTVLVKSKRERIDHLCKDMAVIKEAAFYALEGVVELGANGDVKKAHTRLKENIFEED